MTAEPIARVVDDLRRGRARLLMRDRILNATATERAERPQPVVDATVIYRSLVARERPVDLYGDHPCIAPPWDDAMICYLNEHGNVHVMQLTAQPWPKGERWETPNTVDWDALRWQIDVFVWLGGRDGKGRDFPTTGPVHLMQYAVMPDGQPADMHYVQLVPRFPLKHWENPQLVVLHALSFLSCVNVDAVEPVRPFPQRRRLAKLGVRVHTLVVRPTGRRAASSTKPGGDAAVPLHSVRGHFSEYGERYDKGRLFGKLEGRYWIPAHARGSAEHGEVDKDYLLQPVGTS